MIHIPLKTRPLKETEAARSSVRSGAGMLVRQGAEQTRLRTGMEPPSARMGQAVMERFGKNGGD